MVFYFLEDAARNTANEALSFTAKFTIVNQSARIQTISHAKRPTPFDKALPVGVASRKLDIIDIDTRTIAVKGVVPTDSVVEIPLRNIVAKA